MSVVEIQLTCSKAVDWSINKEFVYMGEVLRTDSWQKIHIEDHSVYQNFVKDYSDPSKMIFKWFYRSKLMGLKKWVRSLLRKSVWKSVKLHNFCICVSHLATRGATFHSCGQWRRWELSVLRALSVYTNSLVLNRLVLDTSGINIWVRSCTQNL